MSSLAGLSVLLFLTILWGVVCPFAFLLIKLPIIFDVAFKLFSHKSNFLQK